MTERIDRQFWEPPSEEVRRLLREGVERLMNDPQGFADVEEATLAVNADLIALEHGFANAVRAASRANINQWATSNLRDPGRPVPANVGRENLALARDVVRYGLEDTIPTGFRAGQNVLLRYWTDLVFDLTSDLPVLHELLDVVTRSVQSYVDDTLVAIQEVVREQREQLAGTTHAARMGTIELILQGAPLTQERASRRLQYDLSQQNLAAIVWTDATTPPDQLERVIDALARMAGSSHHLSVPISPSTSWVWVSSRQPLDAATVRNALRPVEPVRVALGSSAASLAGFRRSHLEALAAQRLARRLSSALVTTYEDIEVVALATGDEERAHEFVERTLGPLALAAPELRDTLRTYLREQSSSTRTAKALFTHRNTVMSRVERAVELLPRDLDGRPLQVALALEIVHHWGAPG